MSSPLHQLCERYGVLSGYTDTWGQTHHTSDVARRALLAAMEVAAATEQQVLDSLQACERSRWLSPLPPVLVVREHERPFRVEVVIAAQHETQPWRWSLRRESGWEDRGEFWPGALAGIERGSCDGQTLVRRQLCLDLALETGYHRLVLEHGADVRAEMVFIVAPASAYQPPVISAGKRAWGLAAQLYALRSTRNWGMGDFGDLGRLLESAAGMGAATVLLNPLHALFPGAPEHASPYSPSSRSWLNTLYLDIEAMADFAECPQIAAEVREFDFQARLCALRAAPQVDYPAVATLKSGLLARLYAHFRAAHLAHHSERARAFRAFQAERGAALRGQALFEALQAHFQAQDATVWAGRPGRAPTMTRIRPRCTLSAPKMQRRWSFTNTCSGRPRCSSRRQGGARCSSGWVSASCSIWRSVWPRVERQPGCSARCMPSVPVPVLRPTRSTVRARTGGCRRGSRTGCVRRPMRPSSSCCAPACAKRGPCVSIT